MTRGIGGSLTMIIGLAGLLLGPSALRAQTEVIGPPIPKEILTGQKRAKKTTPIRTSVGHPRAAVGTSKAKNTFSPVLPPKDYKPPVLSLAEDRHNFGDVFKGEEVVHHFVIKNTGGSALIIQKIKPGCGCTYVKHDKSIPPGGSGLVTLKVNTAKLSAGKQSKWADIHSNDPSNLRKRIYMDGNVTTAFTVSPTYPRLNTVLGEDDTLVVTLNKAVDAEFKVTAVKALNNRVIPELETVVAGQTYKINVKANITGKTKSTYFTDRIQVDVEGANGKKMSQDVPVTIRLKNRISSKPARTVYFRRPEVNALRTNAAAPVVKEVVIKSEVTKSDHNFQITKVEVTDAHFRTEVQPVTPGKEYKILIKIDALPDDPTVKSLKGDLIIHTDDPSQPTIKLRVLAFL